MQFRAEVIPSGKTTTGISVTDDQVASLGKGKRPPVTVTINGYSYRTTIAPMGGNNWISVSAEVRERAGIAARDMVDVTVELDTAPREIEVPADLAEALAAAPEAKAFFESLSYSNKRRHVEPIQGAKTVETRQRRIDKAVAQFREGKK